MSRIIDGKIVTCKYLYYNLYVILDQPVKSTLFIYSLSVEWF